MEKFSKKERILIAARSLFTERGFAGTSIGSIAKQAAVTNSLIFHHFTNKENLWKQVKQGICKDTKKAANVLPDKNLPFNKFLEELIKRSINFYRDNPDIIRMISWQRLEYNSENQIGISLSEESQTWIDCFKHYQEKGEINSNLKPEYIITMILSITCSFVLDKNTFLADKQDKREYIRFCTKTLKMSLTS